MGGRKKEVTTGYEYYGSFAHAVCMGRVDTLVAIYNGDTPLWTGPVSHAAADGDGKVTLTTTIGTVRFYFGTSGQNTDSLLAALQLDLGDGGGIVTVPQSPLRNVAYAVWDDCAFGRQVTPPGIKYEVRKPNYGITVTGGPLIDGTETNPVVAAYELLTNGFWGLGIPTASMGTTWTAAAQTVHDDGLGVSILQDKSDTARSILGKLLWYADAYLYQEAGKLEIALVRYTSTAGLATVDEDSLTDEPNPTHGGWDDTWNQTLLQFTDRARDYEEAVEPYEDPANAAMVQAIVEQDVEAPWVHKRAIAKKLARRAGIRGALPVVTWVLRVVPSLADTLTVGSRFFLDYDKLGISQKLCRVISVTENTRQDIGLRITAVEEFARETSADYLPGDDYFGDESVLDEDGAGAFNLVNTTPRLSWLPSGLRVLDEHNEQDGILVCFERPNQTTDGATVWFTYDENKRAYFPLGSKQNFPSHGHVSQWWGTGHPDRWLVEITFATAWDMAQAEDFLDANKKCYLVAMSHVVDTETGLDQEQVTALWLARPEGAWWEQTDTLRIMMEVEGGTYGSLPPTLEGAGNNGIHLGGQVYFGRMDDFFLYTDLKVNFQRDYPNARSQWWDGATDDTTKERKVKVTLSNYRDEETLSDVTAVIYDRDDTTQCPDGTMSVSWGDRALSGYETFDMSAGNKVLGGTDSLYALVEFMDEGLGRFVYGLETAEDQLKLVDIDLVLGYKALTGVAYYGKR